MLVFKVLTGSGSLEKVGNFKGPISRPGKSEIGGLGLEKKWNYQGKKHCFLSHHVRHSGKCAVTKNGCEKV